MRYLAIILALVLACSSMQLQGQAYKYKQGSTPSMGQSDSWRRDMTATIFKVSEHFLFRDYQRNHLFMSGESGAMMRARYKMGPDRYENYRLDKPLPLKKGKLYLVASDGENNSLFAHYSGIYLGEYRQEKGKPTFIREGIGIDKTRIRGTDTAKYYIGYYKNNKRHGLGFYVDPKGNMYAGEWKRGRLIGKTKRALTPEEAEKIGDYVRKINNLL